jgi:hypothetical protein
LTSPNSKGLKETLKRPQSVRNQWVQSRSNYHKTYLIKKHIRHGCIFLAIVFRGSSTEIIIKNHAKQAQAPLANHVSPE